MRDVERVGVVVPARDEAAHVGGCLAALCAAARASPVPVDVVVVVNGSSDATADVARAHGARVLEVPEPGVGRARALGVGDLLAGADPDVVWIATTDADSRVPPAWLSHQLALAAAGAEVVVGTIRLPPAALSSHARWWAEYQRGVGAGGHRHVHGANLGLRGSAYRAVGGFAELEAHEDADIVRRLERDGAIVVRSVVEPVTTSARTVGRAPTGVATDLREWRSPGDAGPGDTPGATGTIDRTS